MDVGQYDKVKDINSTKDSWCIKAKVVRRWHDKRNGELKSIQLILVDETNHKIQATIKEEYIDRFGSFFAEGDCFSIKNFKVKFRRLDRRPSPHKYKIVFSANTYFHPVSTASIDFGLDDVNFEDLILDRLDQHVLIDLIGEVVHVGGLEIIDSTKQTENYAELLFAIQDNNNFIIECIAYGETAEKAYKRLMRTKGEWGIAVLRWWSINKSSGYGINVHSWRNCSQILVNPDMEEVHDFHVMMSNRTIEISSDDNTTEDANTDENESTGNNYQNISDD